MLGKYCMTLNYYILQVNMSANFLVGNPSQLEVNVILPIIVSGIAPKIINYFLPNIKINNL